MMTKLLLTIATLVSSQAMAQVKFENPVGQNPILVNIVKSDDCSHNTCYLFDSNGKKRIEINFTTGGSFYTLINSAGVVIANKVNLTDEVALYSARQLSLATTDCPVKVFINRDKVQISDIQTSCIVSGIKKTVLVKRDDCGSDLCYLYDNAGKHEMSYRPSRGEYSLSGLGLAGNLIKLDSVSANKMSVYVQNVRPACPMTIEFDFFSGKILKASLACDPLAFDLSSPIRNG